MDKNILGEIAKQLNIYLDENSLEHIDIDTKVSTGKTLLMHAIINTNEKIVSQLVQLGANLEIKINDATALYYACQTDNENIVKILVDGNANVNFVDTYGTTCLIMSCVKGNNNIIREILDAGATINCENILGVSPLIAYLSYNEQIDVEILKRLIKGTKNITAKENVTGFTAYDKYVQKGLSILDDKYISILKGDNCQ